MREEGRRSLGYVQLSGCCVARACRTHVCADGQRVRRKLDRVALHRGADVDADVEWRRLRMACGDPRNGDLLALL